MELTHEQQRALDTADGIPPRVNLPESRDSSVLLSEEDFQWIRSHLPDTPEAPLATDPRTGRKFAVVPFSIYERFQPFFEEDPPSPQERLFLLREFGKRAGWDDPEMDIYNDLDPRRHP